MVEKSSTEKELDNDNPVAYEEVKEDKWGELPEDNYGYASTDERRAKRGMEDWEMVENVPKSQKGVPIWFLAVIVAVLLVAIGLSFPFWGDRLGYERAWVDWGFGGAILYLIVFGGFVYFMVNRYSPSVDRMEDESGVDDTDPSRHSAHIGKSKNTTEKEHDQESASVKDN